MKKVIFGLILFLPLLGHAQGAEVDVNSGRVPIISKSICERPQNQGGWGGTCTYGGVTGFLEGFNFFRNPSDACDNTWPGDTEEFVGICDLQEGASATRGDCCIPKGTAPDISNPDTASRLYSQYIFSSGQCTSIGGSCVDVPDAANILSLGIIPTGNADCGDNNVSAGLCTDVSGDWKNLCCVPKNGEYCRGLQQSTGRDVCSTSGTQGTALPIEYGDYQLLELIPGSDNTSGKLGPYLESLYKVGFVLIVIGAIFMIGFGGFTYMASAGNTSMIKKGKGMITDAIIGLVVALLIWLVLNIINPDLVNLSIDPLPGVSFDPASTGATTADQNSQGGGAATGTFAAKLYSGGNVYTDERARAYLVENSVSVNKANCTSPSQTNCTSLEQWPTVMAGTAVGIRRNCNCEVVVTGGTEAGHATHGRGRAAMDMRRTSALDTFFQRLPRVGTSGGNPIYQLGQVKVWFEDSSHYHIWEPAN